MSPQCSCQPPITGRGWCVLHHIRSPQHLSVKMPPIFFLWVLRNWNRYWRCEGCLATSYIRSSCEDEVLGGTLSLQGVLAPILTPTPETLDGFLPDWSNCLPQQAKFRSEHHFAFLEAEMLLLPIKHWGKSCSEKPPSTKMRLLQITSRFGLKCQSQELGR